jgi:hypothetical protein
LARAVRVGLAFEGDADGSAEAEAEAEAEPDGEVEGAGDAVAAGASPYDEVPSPVVALSDNTNRPRASPASSVYNGPERFMAEPPPEAAAVPPPCKQLRPGGDRGRFV